MIITKMRLKNFRSYSQKELEFNDKLNLIIGKNAQGKTNLLEAIYFAALGKSFRTSKEKEVIKWAEELAKIELFVERKYRKLKIEIIFSKKHKKTIKIDGIPIKKISQLLGELNIIFFSPDELKLIKDSPEERRRFMDIDISQTNPAYFYLIGKYEKILNNRNKLLKMSHSIDVVKETIDIWDRQLVEASKKIILERRRFIEELEPFAKLACSYISDGAEELTLKYVGEDGGTEEELEKNLFNKLSKSLEKDYKLGYTSTGPHRDEINVFINNVEVKSFGSQGQQRTAALSMKLAELEILENRTGEKPVLLLDDVLSELDEERRNKLINFSKKAQTFITSTDLVNVKNGQILEIKKQE